MKIVRPTPLVMNCTVGPDPKAAGMPTRYSAPSTAPSIEPSPPMITMATTRIDCDGSNVDALKRSVTRAKHTPATPARNPERAKAISLARTTRTPVAAAPTSLSRTARRSRATPWSRHTRATRRVSASTPRTK